MENMEGEIIYMKDRSHEGPRDWYGEFCYSGTNLDKYISESKLWEYKVDPGYSKGSGHAAVAVKTTMENLKLIGWESDYEKYKCSEESYNRT